MPNAPGPARDGLAHREHVRLKAVRGRVAAGPAESVWVSSHDQRHRAVPAGQGPQSVAGSRLGQADATLARARRALAATSPVAEDRSSASTSLKSTTTVVGWVDGRLMLRGGRRHGGFPASRVVTKPPVGRIVVHDDGTPARDVRRSACRLASVAERELPQRQTELATRGLGDRDRVPPEPLCRGARPPVRPAAVAVHALGDRRQPVRAPATPGTSPAGRKVVVHDYCYHGSVDETFATLDDAGRVVARRGNIGPPVDPSRDDARWCEFNDVDGAGARRSATATSPPCSVEPALTNVGIVLPEPGLPRRAARADPQARHAADHRRDPHALRRSAAATRPRYGLEPDMLDDRQDRSRGGIPAGAYGMTAGARPTAIARVGRPGGRRRRRHRRDAGRQRAVAGRDAGDARARCSPTRRSRACSRSATAGPTGVDGVHRRARAAVARATGSAPGPNTLTRAGTAADRRRVGTANTESETSTQFIHLLSAQSRCPGSPRSTTWR